MAVREGKGVVIMVKQEEEKAHDAAKSVYKG